MQDYEKLGAFYLGKKVDPNSQELVNEIVLYDAKDLTTHAVIIGMTGSGKTGLGIGLIEEAVMDSIPVIAIDPKGDMGNLLLTFPKLSAADFTPWIDPQTAIANGKTVEEFGQSQAALWKQGLKKWGQTGKRIRQLRETADFAIYTPGSSAGRSVSVLDNFNAPPAAVRNDADVYNDKVQAAATGILSLIGENADPITSREHILISNILNHYWQAEKNIDIGGLISAIQQPPIEKVGVMDVDSFFPDKDRFSLAMKLNSLLAAPGFKSWMQGEPLDAARFFHTENGRPRVSVMSIAHLSDEQRMFFVTMLLSEILTWVRTQPGTGSLRALLYMDEIFGYMPPTANPPSKILLLTLLKQARAYGLGLVLSTQNPVDLDYKGLSNTGTWFIGRLQTERDKMRVMEGLESAASRGHFDRSAMEQTLAGLGKRKFLLHNVHEDEDIVFGTRWVMSYLAGPMTREQIKRLNQMAPASQPISDKKAAAAKSPTVAQEEVLDEMPAIDPKITQYYLPVFGKVRHQLVYQPMVVAAAELLYSSARYNVNQEKKLLMLGRVEDAPVPLEWEEAQPLCVPLDNLLEQSEFDDAQYAEVMALVRNAKNYTKWERLFKRWLRNDNALTLYRYKPLKAMSESGESEGQFRIRLRMIVSEKRDAEVAKLREKYAPKLTVAQEKLRKAKQKLEVELAQAKKKKLDTVLSFGTAILGSLLGRKKASYSSASRIRTAVGRLGSSNKESGDVDRAREDIEVLQNNIEQLSQTLEREIVELKESYHTGQLELDEIVIRPKSTDILIHFVALAWVPHDRDTKGNLRSLID